MRWLLLTTALVALLLAADPVSARDHDRARRAVEAGEALPLDQIMRRVSNQYPGRLLDAELRERGNRLEYRMRILGADGRVVELRVDARSGSVLQARGGR